MSKSFLLLTVIALAAIYAPFIADGSEGAGHSEVTLSDNTTYHYETYGNDFGTYRATIFGAESDAAVLYISTVLEGHNVTEISSGAFSECTDTEAVIIPERVMTIGSGAFSGCVNLKSVYFLGDAPTIGSDAFPKGAAFYRLADSSGWSGYSASEIEKISQKSPDGSVVDHLIIEGEAMVSGGTPSESGTLTIMPTAGDHDITSIGPYSFAGRNNPHNTGIIPRTDIKTVTISSQQTIVRERAFYYNTGIEMFASSNSVIMDEAFRAAASLREMPNVAGSAWYIGFEAFRECRSFDDILIGDSVIFVGEGAFKLCSSANAITIEASSPVMPWTFAYCSSAEKIEFRGDVGTIGNAAFYMCESASSVSISDSVVSIGADAFFECGSMTDIYLGKSLESIGRGAFSECSALNGVILPETVSRIDPRAFAYCPGMTDIYFSGKMPEFGDNVFLNDDVTVHCREVHKDSWTQFDGKLVIDKERGAQIWIMAIIVFATASICLAAYAVKSGRISTIRKEGGKRLR
jgi:hypothetical protein